MTTIQALQLLLLVATIIVSCYGVMRGKFWLVMAGAMMALFGFVLALPGAMRAIAQMIAEAKK